MKKVLLTLALAAFTFAANAQFVVGGMFDISYNGGDTKYTGVAGKTDDLALPYNSRANTSLGYAVMPKVGFQLNDKMQVGVAFGIQGGSYKDYSRWTNEYEDYKDFEGWSKRTYRGYTFAPYFRYNLGTISGLTFFCEAQLSLYFGGRDKYHVFNTEINDPDIFYIVPALDTTYKSDYKNSYIAFTIVPGLNYKFNEHLSADLYIDLLGFSFVRYTSSTDNYNVDGDKYVEHDVDCFVGANFNAQTLTDQFGHFRLGFNYHF